VQDTLEEKNLLISRLQRTLAELADARRDMPEVSHIWVG